jgi:hypothetical protein
MRATTLSEAVGKSVTRKIYCNTCETNCLELPADALLARDFTFTCRVCASAVPQRATATFPHAFDHDLPRNHSTSVMVVDDSEAVSDEQQAGLPHAIEIGATMNTQTGRPLIPDGFSIIKIRRVRKPVPPIANDLSLTGKRKTIANLYWNLQWRSDEIAEELAMTQNAVKCVINRLRRQDGKCNERKSQRSALKRKARKLFRMGATVRAVAAELGISIGKAQALRPAA